MVVVVLEIKLLYQHSRSLGLFQYGGAIGIDVRKVVRMYGIRGVIITDGSPDSELPALICWGTFHHKVLHSTYFFTIHRSSILTTLLYTTFHEPYI